VTEVSTPNKPNNRERRLFTGLLGMARKYVLFVVSVLLMASLVIGFTINFTIRDSMNEAHTQVFMLTSNQILMSVNQDLLVRIFLVLLITLIVTSVAGLLFLHRVGGPLFRIKSVLKSMADGDLPKQKISFREGDYFRELADELNRLIDRLKGPQ